METFTGVKLAPRNRGGSFHWQPGKTFGGEPDSFMQASQATDLELKRLSTVKYSTVSVCSDTPPLFPSKRHEGAILFVSVYTVSKVNAVFYVVWATIKKAVEVSECTCGGVKKNEPSLICSRACTHKHISNVEVNSPQLEQLASVFLTTVYRELSDHLFYGEL